MNVKNSVTHLDKLAKEKTVMKMKTHSLSALLDEILKAL
jgi:hypothetical protein